MRSNFAKGVTTPFLRADGVSIRRRNTAEERGKGCDSCVGVGMGNRDLAPR